jgi:hypothetical protein
MGASADTEIVTEIPVIEVMPRGAAGPRVGRNLILFIAGRG